MKGSPSLSDARLVVLENDGEWSVVSKDAPVSDDSALYGLPIPGRPHNSPESAGHLASPTGPQRLP